MSIYWRWYIYALHGYATEIMFTAMWEFVFNLNWKLMGNTSIWIMPIYGISGLVAEKIYLFCTKRNMPLYQRGVCYLMWTYFWEFTSGFVLKQFDLCPWDYSHYDADFMGLITLEYAPLWYLLSLFLDRFVLKYTLKLYWGPTHTDFRVHPHTE